MQLQVDSETVRVAMVTWSDQAIIQFGLDTFTTQEDVVHQIRQTKVNCIEPFYLEQFHPFLDLSNMHHVNLVNMCVKC